MKDSAYWNRFTYLMKTNCTSCRNPYNSYVRDIKPRELNQDAKLFWSFGKSKRRDNNRVALLRAEDGLGYSGPGNKSNKPNKQFTSVFTNESIQSTDNKLGLGQSLTLLWQK